MVRSDRHQYKIQLCQPLLFCSAYMRRPPDISIDWTDVTIEIKVCAPEIQPEERKFVK